MSNHATTQTQSNTERDCLYFISPFTLPCHPIFRPECNLPHWALFFSSLPPSLRSFSLPHLGAFDVGVFLSDAIRHMGGHGSHLGRSLNMEHLVVKVNVGPDLLQHGALGGPGQEQGLVRLQAPGPQGLQGPDPRAGCAAGRHQVSADGAVQTVTPGVELLLQLAQGLQEALQRALDHRRRQGERRVRARWMGRGSFDR